MFQKVKKMSDTHSDGLRLERVNSLEPVVEYDRVPKQMPFIFIFKDKDKKSYAFFEYSLAKDKLLPYVTCLKGT